MNRTIDTVLFDLDDTLHDDSDAYRRAARRVADEVAAERDGIEGVHLYHTYVAEAQGFWKKLSVEHLAMPIHDARVELWYEALSRVGIDDAALAAQCSERYARYRSDLLALYPGARELLVELRARGCKLAIVSNGFASTHHHKIDVLGLRPLVDAIFLADEMGMVKPDARIFELVCRSLDSVPERSAMVGDRYDRDVIGAQSVGLFTVLIDVHAIPLPEGAVPPDAVVDTLAEVVAALPLAGRQEAYSEPPNRST